MDDLFLSDFSHITKASHITFSNTAATAQSTTPTNTFMSHHPPYDVESVIQGLVAPGMGCPRCAQIIEIREKLKGVEASYLQEIMHLKCMVSQIDRERLDAISRMEQVLLSLERSRKQVLLKDQEIHSLEWNLRQLEDKLHRSEYELNSLRQLYRRDIEFYHSREELLFGEKEECSRASIVSAEAGWRSALEARWIGILTIGREERCRVVGDKRALHLSPRQGNPKMSSHRSLSSSSMHDRQLSITRHMEIDRGGDGGGEEEVAILPTSLSCSMLGKGELMADLWRSKGSVEEANKILHRELRSKEDQIASLLLLVQKQQSISAEENSPPSRPSHHHVLEEGLVVEMQDEIDDMLRGELVLLQKCERYRLEAEAMEERLQVLQWLLTKHSLASSTCVFKEVDVTAERNTSSAFHGASNGVYFLDNDSFMGKKRTELCALVSQSVTDALSDVLQGHLLPIRLSVESICSSSDELHNIMQRCMGELVHHNGARCTTDVLEDLKKNHATFLSDARQILQKIVTEDKSNITGATASSVIHDALEKLGQLTAESAKIVDGKLSEILTYQSVMSQQLGAALAASSLCVTGVGKQLSPTRGSKQVHFEKPSSESPARGDSEGNTRLDSLMLPSHEWDMIESDDEFIPSPPCVFSARKTPYDIDV